MSVLLFAASLVILVLEVFYTRLYSVICWSNNAFAILSFAFLGIGVSGLVVYLMPKVFRRERAEIQLAWLAPLFGLSILVSYLLILAVTHEYSHSALNVLLPVSGLVTVGLVSALPFFVGGLLVSLVFTHFSDRVSRLYFADLLGACVGAAIALPAIDMLNGPRLVPALGIAMCLAGLGYSLRSVERSQRLLPAVAAGACALLIGLFVTRLFEGELRIRHTKGRPDMALIEKWDALARVTVEPASRTSVWFWIDASVPTPILKFDGNFDSVGFLKHNVLQLVHHLGPFDSTLIIGPGGGSDVLTALSFGNRDITAVEVNRSIVGLMTKKPLSNYSGGLYLRPEVHMQIGDGRGFVAQLSDRKDLIQATFVDTWVMASSGSHTLTENYLYTVEAIQDFLSHLKPKGILSMSRWGGAKYGFGETYRLVAVAARALQQRGVAHPEDQIVVVRGPSVDDLVVGAGYQNVHGDMESMCTILIKPEPFSAEQITQLQNVARENAFVPLWLGTERSEPVLKRLFEQQGKDDFYTDYNRSTGVDISPVVDDRPFFFSMLRPQDFPSAERVASLGADGQRAYRGLSWLYGVLYATSILAFTLIFIPLLVRIRDLRPVASTLPIVSYFVCLGLGYIGIEIALVQRFSLFLGHPIYSLVLVLGALLLASGVGSFWTGRLEVARSSGLRMVVVLVPLLALYTFALPPLLQALIAHSLWMKVVVGFLLVVPLGFVMGTLFPLGIKASASRARLVPWLWGTNAGFSVLGSTLCLFIAMAWGYTAAWLLFTSIYALAGVCMLRFPAPNTKGPDLVGPGPLAAP
jgi:hypothetical protein